MKFLRDLSVTFILWTWCRFCHFPPSDGPFP